MSNTIRPRRTTPRPKPAPDGPIDFDLDALTVEATGRPFAFRLKGERFTMAHPEIVDWQVELGAANNNIADVTEMLKTLLGDDWDRFRAMKFPGVHFKKLLQACGEYYGVGLGESAAS